MADLAAWILKRYWRSAGFGSEQQALDRLERMFTRRGFSVQIEEAENP